MFTIKLDKMDKLMILSEELRCISYLQSLLYENCRDELKDNRSTASATNTYLMDLNENTTERLCNLVFDDDFAVSVKCKQNKPKAKIKAPLKGA